MKDLKSEFVRFEQRLQHSLSQAHTTGTSCLCHCVLLAPWRCLKEISKHILFKEYLWINEYFFSSVARFIFHIYSVKLYCFIHFDSFNWISQIQFVIWFYLWCGIESFFTTYTNTNTSWCAQLDVLKSQILAYLFIHPWIMDVLKRLTFSQPIYMPILQ